MKKKLIYLIIMALLVVTVVACGNGGGDAPAAPAADEADADDGAGEADETPAPVEDAGYITWMLLDWGNLDEEKFIPFTEETGISVVLDRYGFNELFEVIEVRIAAGTSDFDVISVDVPMVAAYATRGYIMPVDEWFTADDKAQWIPSAVEAGSWQGVFYAPPMNTSTQALFYNIDLLAEAGVTIRDSDVNNRLTYEELEVYARAVLDAIDPDRNLGYEGIVFQQVSRTYQMNSLANSRGQQNIGPDGLTVDGVINTDEWVYAFTWWQRLFEEGLALRGFTPEDSSPNFNSGRTVFMIGGTWTPTGIADVNFGFTALPAWRGFEDQVGSPTGSWHFGINSGSEKADMAAEFIRYMSLGEGNDLWLAANNDVPSTMRAIEAILNDPNADPLMQIAVHEAAYTAVPRALTPGFSEYQTIMNNTFEDIRNGADVRQALNDAVAQITSAMDRYR